MPEIEEYPAEVQAHIEAGGNGISTLPAGMTQEEADELVRIADEEQALKDAAYAAEQETQ